MFTITYNDDTPDESVDAGAWMDNGKWIDFFNTFATGDRQVLRVRAQKVDRIERFDDWPVVSSSDPSSTEAPVTPATSRRSRKAP